MGMAVSVPRYTVDDLEHFPDDGNRYELLDGLLLVTPAHDVVCHDLCFFGREAMMRAEVLNDVRFFRRSQIDVGQKNHSL